MSWSWAEIVAVTSLVFGGTGMVGGIAAWRQGAALRNKTSAETDDIVTRVLKQTIETMEAEMSRRDAARTAERQELHDENSELRRRVDRLETDMDLLSEDNRRLRRENADLRRTVA